MKTLSVTVCLCGWLLLGCGEQEFKSAEARTRVLTVAASLASAEAMVKAPDLLAGVLLRYNLKFSERQSALLDRASRQLEAYAGDKSRPRGLNPDDPRVRAAAEDLRKLAGLL